MLVILLGVVSASGTAQEMAGWIELETPHFYFFSDADANTVEQVARRLEEFRSTLSRLFPGLVLDLPPLGYIFLFKDENSFLPYTLRTPDGKPADIGGFAVSVGRERMHVAVHLGGAASEEHLFHEYVHLFLRLNFKPLPTWLDEGLASLFASTHLSNGALSFGRLSPGDWQFLRENELLSLATLVKLDPKTDFTGQLKKRSLFYAQATLLVHYLLVAEQGKRRSQFLRFLQEAGRGVAPEKAWARSFAEPLSALEEPLQEYLRRRRPEGIEAALPLAPALPPLQPVALRPAQARARLAELLLTLDRVDEAEELLRELATAGEADAEVFYTLGRLALDRGQTRKAEEFFRAGLELQSGDARLRYFAARTLVEGRLGELLGTEELRAALNEIVGWLEPLTEQPEEFPAAYQLMVRARISRDDPSSQLIPLLEQARQLAPEDTEFDLLLGYLYMQEERWVAAQGIFQRLRRRASSRTERADAGQWLRYLNAARKDGKRARKGEVLESEDAEAGREVESRPPAEEKSSLRVETGEASESRIMYVRGILAEVACTSEGAVLTLHARKEDGGRGVLRLAVPADEPPLLFDRTASGQKIECHTAGISVGIHFRVAPRPDGVAGVALTVEFYPVAH